MEIQLEPLRKTNILVATPCYGGMATATYHRSLEWMQTKFKEWGIPFSIQTMYNESLIPRGRNTLADMFLQGEWTHLMFIDADIEFRADDIALMLHYDKDIIGGAYPLKGIHWEYVIKAVKNNPDITPEEVSKCAMKYSAHFLNDVETVDLREPCEVKELATGFMLIKREVFEKMKDVVDSYTPDKSNLGSYGPSDKVYDFFPSGVFEGRYESEDYSFCRIWRQLGGKVWLCPWIKLNHGGFYNFPGDLVAAIKNLRELH